jgi:hypothetical protein
MAELLSRQVAELTLVCGISTDGLSMVLQDTTVGYRTVGVELLLMLSAYLGCEVTACCIHTTNGQDAC